MEDRQRVKVLFAASEADPFFKVGGLGDYAGSLPAALKKHFDQTDDTLDIRVVLPLHDLKTVEKFNLTRIHELSINNSQGKNLCHIYESFYSGIRHYFIRQVKPGLESNAVYGHDQHQTAHKFALFSIAALRMLEEIKWTPDIIHTNDWHTALINHLAKTDPLAQTHQLKTLLTIHNMPFMGYGSEPVYNSFGIEPNHEKLFPTWAHNLPLPMGIAAADQIVAVSPTYAQELTTNYFAYGLENYFLAHSEKITGIINGIDYQKWDPEIDKNIIQNYSKSSIGERKKNKKELFKEIGFRFNPDEPLLVVISRLENQKGIDLILDGFSETANWNWKAIVLGSGHHGYEYAFRALERVFPKKIHAVLEYNPFFAKKLYASGDIILMPSLYEPCGLSQMIAMRYGCVPIAHAVGGLKDSITINPDENRTGFLFKPASKEKFIESLGEAIRRFQNKDKWKIIQTNGMEKDFSWIRSASNYADLYLRLKNE